MLLSILLIGCQTELVRPKPKAVHGRVYLPPHSTERSPNGGIVLEHSTQYIEHSHDGGMRLSHRTQHKPNVFYNQNPDGSSGFGVKFSN